MARADRICLETSRHFDELPEPVGGVADDWEAGLDLLDRAADKLDDAEAGDPDAQDEALRNLEARAQEHFDGTRTWSSDRHSTTTPVGLMT